MAAERDALDSPPHGNHSIGTVYSNGQIDLSRRLPVSSAVDPQETVAPSAAFSVDEILQQLSTRLERYRPLGILGRGGYGSVFKAFDEQLQRHVAIKVPHASVEPTPRSLDRFLEEARTLARLEHPRIVTVHDVVTIDNGVPCIVSAFIEGTSLAARMRTDPFSLHDALELLIKICEALNFMHARKIVHRDIKPGNILLNLHDEPFLADFGLALRGATSSGKGHRIGTPAYMSPEQARGESHLVDGRSDLFSLGVVFYEMLTGQRPFGDDNRNQVFDRLLNQETQPPRQLNPSVPKELERICLRALAKRASDRYASAADFSEDLQHFLERESDFSFDSVSQADVSTDRRSQTAETRVSGESSRQVVPLVVPRGLQSYERHDRAFFCSLLPGPLDREGVPECLRFWQRRLQQNDATEPLRVGVIYGPSGCGKSSLVKAGLIPLLSEDTQLVFVEATRSDTENRLLRSIRRRRALPPGTDRLSEAIQAVRENEEAKPQQLLLVIDQFEQWLHGRGGIESSELLRALRQCDGQSIQCLLLVRDDFWLSFSRFMTALEIPIKQNVNATLVDLFSPGHARYVLHLLGAAYDRLPKEPHLLSQPQIDFLDRVVNDLSEEGKVFPIRLSLLVEMLKNETWDLATWKRFGGTQGIGYKFLEEAFSSELAPAAQKTHEIAVRHVLQCLLPDAGVEIKGNRQPESRLMEVSGYQDQPHAFAEMMRILEIDLRLIRSTSQSGISSSGTGSMGATDSEGSFSESGQGHYQLTHDYLVPAVTEWLTRRQKQTRRGRAELRLAEYASLWAAKPSMKLAPSWSDWLAIQLWSSPSHWSTTQRQMMAKATKHYLGWTGLLIGSALAIFLVIWTSYHRHETRSLISQLQVAEVEQVPALLDAIHRRAWFAHRELSNEVAAGSLADSDRWRNSLALLPFEARQEGQLVREALEVELGATVLMAKRLHPLSTESHAFLWRKLESDQVKPAAMLRAAVLIALAGDEASQRKRLVEEFGPQITDAYLAHAEVVPQDSRWILESFASLPTPFLQSVRAIALDPERTERRSLATSFCLQFLRERPREFLEFFFDASLSQQERIVDSLETHWSDLQPVVESLASEPLAIDLPQEEFDRLARRRAVAAALLHRQGLPERTWTLFRGSSRPDCRSYLINRIAAFGTDVDQVANRYSRELDVSARRGLLMTLGYLWDAELNEQTKNDLLHAVQEAFRDDPDPGIHSVAEWWLRHIGEAQWVDDWIKAQAGSPIDSRKNWYVDAEGHTMAIFDAREIPEIGRVFAMSTKEVTVAQMLRFRPDHEYYESRSPDEDCPVGMLKWFQCTDYCRWLSRQNDLDLQSAYPATRQSDLTLIDTEAIQAGHAYRLPTAAEWVFACAAGTTSTRYFGSTDELIDDYVWYYETSLTPELEILYRPAGSKRPNDFGLFAMYDGIREWGHEGNATHRVILGGSSSQERFRIMTNQATRHGPYPYAIAKSSNGFFGMRVARTMPIP